MVRQAVLFSIESGTGATANRDHPSHYGAGNTNCIGSDCAMWQATDNETLPSHPDLPDQPSEPAGYCGLSRR
jgi:hypothetical protein